MAKKLNVKSILKSALLFMFTDKYTISRYVEVVNELDGTTGQVLTPIKDESDAIVEFDGRISYGEKPAIDLVGGTATSQKELILFTLPNADVREGDSVEIKRIDDDGSVIETIRGRLGKPNTYPSHNEIKVLEAVRA